MRNITQAMLDEYSSGRVHPALMAEMYFDSGMIGMWTGYGTLTWNEKTYLGGGNFIGISPIKETQENTAEGIVATLNGIPSSVIAAGFERVRGRKFVLYIGSVLTKASVMTEDGTGGVMTEDGGKVLLESQFVSDPYRIFTGLMDVTEFTDDGNYATVRLSVENALIRGRRTKVARYTAEDQKRNYSNDKGFDYINALQDKEVVW